MITLLNRRELMTDSSAEELARVKEALKAKGIECKVKALRRRGGPRGQAPSSAATAFPSTSVGAGAFRQIDLTPEPWDPLYRLYVRRKDYARACMIAGK